MKDDIGSIIGTILTISLGFLIVGGGINPNRLHLPDEPIPLMWGWVVLSKRIIYEACIVILFSTLGYTGVDIALRLFSVTNKKINAAIDYKTTQADAANNTTDHPTPK